jgi:hypothetical protein
MIIQAKQRKYELQKVLGKQDMKTFYVRLCNSSCNFIERLVKFPFLLKNSSMVLEFAQYGLKGKAGTMDVDIAILNNGLFSVNCLLIV